MQVKVSPKFEKSLKEHKNKKGLVRAIRAKIADANFDKSLELSHQKMIDSDGWTVKKIDATSAFGAYRIIVARNEESSRVVYDFYFKGQKADMDSTEKANLKEFLLECDDTEYFESLSDIEALS